MWPPIRRLGARARFICTCKDARRCTWRACLERVSKIHFSMNQVFPQGLLRAAYVMSYTLQSGAHWKVVMASGGAQRRSRATLCFPAPNHKVPPLRRAVRGSGRNDNSYFGRTLFLQYSIKPAFFLAPSGSAETEPFQRTIFETSSNKKPPEKMPMFLACVTPTASHAMQLMMVRTTMTPATYLVRGGRFTN